MKSIVRFGVLLFCIPLLLTGQQIPDSVTVTSTQDCCFNFLVKNRNSQKQPIDDFHIIVLSGGVSVRLAPSGPSAPSTWLVTNANPDTVSFAVSPVGGNFIRAGQQLDGFNVCFNNSVSTFAIKWITTSQGQIVSTGTLQLNCLVTCDNVNASPTGNCCFDWSIQNANSMHEYIDDFHLQVLTPGVTINSQTAPSSWVVQTSGSNFVNFGLGPFGGNPIPPGGSMKGFLTCFTLPATGIGTFQVRWASTRGGKEICADTVTLQCTPVPAQCDSIDATLIGNCCFDFGIRNRNATQTPIEDFHISILTPGVTVRPTPTAALGWTVSSWSTTFVNYLAATAPLAPGANINGFNVCFDFASGVASPFQIVWQTTAGGTILCQDTMWLQCALTQQCDSVSVLPDPNSECCYYFTLKNRHLPASDLNDFHIKILSPGATVVAGSATGPWAVTFASASDVTFSGPNQPLHSGDDLSGFYICFDKAPTVPNTIILQWESTFNGKVVCSGTTDVLCNKLEQKCDTIRVKALDKCCFDFGFLNRHLPAGLVNDFHLSILTPGVTIGSSPVAPGGWSVDATGSNFVNFNTSANPVGPNLFKNGFIVCFNNIPNSGVFKVKWQTTLDKQVLCQDSLYMKCGVNPPVCDSVETTNALQDCCYRIVVKNRHQPPSLIDDVHFNIITPGVTFRPTPIAPTNWSVQSFTPTTVSFVTQNVPIKPDSNLAGFVLCFDEDQTSQSYFRVVWETTRAGKVICSDTLNFDCRPKPIPCDSVGVSKQLDDCCFEFFVKNNHNGPLDDLHFTVLTPGVFVRPVPIAPFGWGLSGFSMNFAFFRTASAPLFPGMTQGGFVVCFDMAAPPPPSFKVLWETTLQGKVICYDTLTLQCGTVQQTCDSVKVKNLDDCCFDFTIQNRHAPAGVNAPVNDFHVSVLTSGVTIRPTPTFPTSWALSSLTATDIVFKDASGVGIPGGGDLGGFILCFDKVPASGVFKIQWCTTFDGHVICCDTLTLQCAGSTGTACDSVTVKQQSNCCFDFTLFNKHGLPGTSQMTNDFHLNILTTGVTIIPSPAAPLGWVVTNSTSTSASFTDATGGGIAPGGNLSGFNVCFGNIPPTTSFRIEWCSTFNGNIICCDTLVLQCQPSAGTCDSILVKPLDNCCYEVNLVNTHSPSSVITDFHIQMFSGTIRPNVVLPSGWVVSSQTSTTLDIKDPSGVGIVPNGILGPMVFCFDEGAAAPIILQWCTTQNDKPICCDTAQFTCPPPNNQCDKVSGIIADTARCCWDFTVTNQHLPSTSNITDFHITVLTAGVQIVPSLTSGPGGWTPTSTPITANWVTTGPGIAPSASLPGFKVCFNASQIGNNPFMIEWRTTKNEQTICIDTLTISCPKATGVETLPGPHPEAFILHQNYPNPFNPMTMIAFDIPYAADMELTVFDATGRTHLYLVKEYLEAGLYQAVFDASLLPSGTYFYRLRTKDFIQTRSMTLIK